MYNCTLLVACVLDSVIHDLTYMCMYNAMHIQTGICRPVQVTRFGRVMKTDGVWSYLVRGFKFVLPYQSSELIHCCMCAHVALFSSFIPSLP